MALWCGFVLESPDGRVYNAGDTGFGDGAIFAKIAGRLGAPDVAILPIGAYEPRWFMKEQHVNPEEAVRIMLPAKPVRRSAFIGERSNSPTSPAWPPKEALASALQQHGISGGALPRARTGRCLARKGLIPTLSGMAATAFPQQP